MKIYTKTGDRGETSLVGGKRVSKASVRVCAYGDMDELISHIGLLRSMMPDPDNKLRRIQEVLMIASAHVASENENPRLVPFPSGEDMVLEEEIDRLSDGIPPMKSFILPSGPASAAQCHITRCVCRRCERACVALDDHRPDMSAVLRYLNRLSDYFFALGRSECHRHGVEEDFWTVQ